MAYAERFGKYAALENLRRDQHPLPNDRKNDDYVGCISGTGVNDAQTVWIVDAHRDNGKRFVARSEEKLTAFLELESVIRGVTH